MLRFTSLLVANRGEIACRVIRTARALGYRTVAVYSEADAQAPHTKLADEAVCIGPAPAKDSYLLSEKILEAARKTGAQAVHPGYGFLSENSDFARACEEAGLVFVGPSPDCVSVMGNKAEAKRRMLEAGVPCIPGYEGADQSDATLQTEGEKTGFPLMVKAAAGGGGRGMRLVNDKQSLSEAIVLARSEAQNAFGSGELILEKAVQDARHVEVQVFADSKGNTIHLGERDCSIQRRHQKIIEEAPGPFITQDLRQRMGMSAVKAAQSVSYCGAGTVEFLLDREGQFYFLEMNTRLQVEHPVTECITGLDLVALQLSVAQGETLPLKQEDVSFLGHAIEVRLYAENPARDFLPSTGPVELWKEPAGAGIRVDSGICTGQEITPFYDPMVAKIIASGETRETARLRLTEALKKTVLFGVKTNKDFLAACLENEIFAKGEMTTGFISDVFGAVQLVDHTPSFEDVALAGVLASELEYKTAQEKSVIVSPVLKNWSSAGVLNSRRQYTFGEATYNLVMTATGPSSWRVCNADMQAEVHCLALGVTDAEFSVNGMQKNVHFLSRQRENAAELYVSVEGRTAFFRDLIQQVGIKEEKSGGGHVTAPMHGQLLEIFVNPGDTVSKGQRLAVLEAMKMQHEILSNAQGVVKMIAVHPGIQVSADELLMEIDVEKEGTKT